MKRIIFVRHGELNGKKEGECKEYYKSGTLYKIRIVL